MKIKNISKKTITVPFKTEGSVINVSLEPGQIVYCEEKAESNNAITVFKRKNAIELSNDDKPKNGKYYHPYGVLSHQEVLALKQHTPHVSNVDDEDDEDDEFVDLIDSNVVVDDVDEEDVDVDLKSDVDDEDDEDEEDEDDEDKGDNLTDNNTLSEKNKGGRPKGSKNKSKKGRPKKKKPIGRPKKS